MRRRDLSSRNPGTRDPMLARAALALYPPSWRTRYRDEVLALLEESGGGLRAVASLAWRALPAWIWPPAHLHDRPARMRPRARALGARAPGARAPGACAARRGHPVRFSPFCPLCS